MFVVNFRVLVAKAAGTNLYLNGSAHSRHDNFVRGDRVSVILTDTGLPCEAEIVECVRTKRDPSTFKWSIQEKS